jgi:putative transposase
MKLTQKAVKYIVKDVVKHGLTTRYVAKLFKISQRRVQQLVKEYKETGNIPKLNKSGRKPYRIYPLNFEKIIVSTYNKTRSSASIIAKIIREKHSIPVSNNKVHEILKANGMAHEDKNKQVRKKPWIRYERKHSLSAVHMDWAYNSESKKWVCAVLDDASRLILAAGEFDNATAENSISLLDEGYNKYLHIAPIREVITDHGAQFYANKRDKDGNAEHSFESYCQRIGIKHILCKYNHPQSNGKIEKWFHLYQRFRSDFENINDLIVWYNTIRPHMSLDLDNLETPEKAFYRKSEDIILGNFIRMAEGDLK